MSTRHLTHSRTLVPAAHPALLSSAILLLVVGVLTACLTGAFRVERIAVVGAGVPQYRVEQAAGVLGQNVFSVRSDQIVWRVSRLPTVEVTRVDVSFPNTVTVYAHLRQGYALWQNGKTVYVLDQTGRIIGTSPAPSALPLIVAVDSPSPPDFGMMQAVRYADTVLPGDPDGAILPAQLYRQYGLVLTGRSGWHALIGTGTPQNLGARVATLSAALKKIADQGQQLLFVDLRRGQPYYCQRSVGACVSMPRQFATPAH
ncbi:MAG TPA: hypothetical protein VKX16_16775 [Chloroflexota bacterium]|nr:hypothetical protein [Chloroflexota bacterium]